MAYNHFPDDLKEELLIWADEKPGRLEKIPAWLGDAVNSIWRRFESMQRRMLTAESRVRVISDRETRDETVLAVGSWEHPIACHPRDRVFVNLGDFQLELRVVFDREGKPLELEVSNSRPSHYKMVVAPRASNAIYVQGVVDS